MRQQTCPVYPSSHAECNYVSVCSPLANTIFFIICIFLNGYLNNGYLNKKTTPENERRTTHQ